MNEEKQTDETKDSVEVQGGTAVPLVFRGDEHVAKIKYNRLYSKEQIEFWHAELKKSCPKVPPGILAQTLDLFSTHPHVFDQVVKEHQADPTCFLKNEPLKFDYDPVTFK